MLNKISIITILILSGCSTAKKYDNSPYQVTPYGAETENNTFKNNLTEFDEISNDEIKNDIVSLDQMQNINNDIISDSDIFDPTKNENSISNEDVNNVEVYTDKKKQQELERQELNKINDLSGSMLLNKHNLRKNYLLTLTSSISLKDALQEFVKKNGYKLVWDTSYDVYFENNVTYRETDIVQLLKNIANDLNTMAIDIHMNIYIKNKVIVVYSVRK